MAARGGSDENSVGLMGSMNNQGGLGAGAGKFPVATVGNNRRALSNINRNIIGAPSYPYPAANKRGLSEREAICAKNLPIPVERPITRKFAAQLSNKHRSKPQEIKKPVPSVPISNESTPIVDLEDYESDNDFPAPMFVQHTEAMLEGIDRMEEVEMEDVAEDPVIDIDSCDKLNPRAAVDYVDDLYSFYRKTERCSLVPPNYMEQQMDINERMRGILIDWLIEVHYKFELMEETLYLTVNLIDRFLAVQQVMRKKLQLVGVTAMFLACKYEEVQVPVVEDLILISDKAYTRQEVLDMEKLMAMTLQYNLSLPTAFVFMTRFLKAAQSDKKLELLSFYMMDLSLVENEMIKFPPSLLAAAAIYTAQCSLSQSKQWTKTHEWYTKYTEDHLMECSRMMARFHKNAATGKLTGVHRKYSTSKFGYVARMEPANFLLEADS